MEGGGGKCANGGGVQVIKDGARVEVKKAEKTVPSQSK